MQGLAWVQSFSLHNTKEALIYQSLGLKLKTKMTRDQALTKALHHQFVVVFSKHLHSF